MIEINGVEFETTGEVKHAKDEHAKEYIEAVKRGKGWSRHYRNMRGIWEDIRPHGIGHCNDIHTCDSCCDGMYK
jgi:hypothetical protein